MPHKYAALFVMQISKSHQSKFKFSHICVAQIVCKHFVRLLCRTTAGKGIKWMRLEIVKEKKSNFLYLYRSGAHGVYTSESQDISFQLHVGFAGKFGKPFKGENV